MALVVAEGIHHPQSDIIELRRGEPRRVASHCADVIALDEIARKLCEIELKPGIDRTLAIGELMLNECFGGDPQLWHDRRRNKNNSIRRLAERADCPLCKSALNEAIGVYAAVATMPHLRTYEHVASSHIAAVLVLPPEMRRPVLDEAEHSRWSVREVKQRVVELRRAKGRYRSHPNQSEESRIVALLKRIVHWAAEADAQVACAGSPSDSLREAVGRLAGSLSKYSHSLADWAALPARHSQRNSVLRVDEIGRSPKALKEWSEHIMSKCPDTTG